MQEEESGKSQQKVPVVLSVPPGRHPFGGGTSAGCPEAQGANRQIPAAQRWTGISKPPPTHTHTCIRSPHPKLWLCYAFLQEAKSCIGSLFSPAWDTQAELSSSRIWGASFPPFHTEDWKGDGGSVLPSLLHHQHSAGEEKGKGKAEE